MTHEYGDPISSDALDAAANRAIELWNLMPEDPSRYHFITQVTTNHNAKHAVQRSGAM